MTQQENKNCKLFEELTTHLNAFFKELYLEPLTTRQTASIFMFLILDLNLRELTNESLKEALRLKKESQNDQ